MLNNLLNAFAYWFKEEERISWIPEEWTKWIWWAALALAALFLLIIIILFFKAIVRTRQRELVRRVASEEAEVTRKKKRAERQARREQRKAEKEARRRKKDEVLVQEEPKAEVPPVVVAAPVEPVVVVQQPKEEVKRELLGISFETGIVQRHFTVGDQFTCDGLVVKAYYNLAPTTDTLVSFAIVDDIEYNRLSDSEKDTGVYVLRPSLREAGIKYVVVRFQNRAGMYTIAVKPLPESDRVVEVPVEVEKIVEIPVEKVVEVPVEKIVEKIVEVPVDNVVERVVEVPVEKIIEKIVEVPVEKIVEVPVEKVIEKVVEVPVEKIVEVPVEKVVEVPVEAPVAEPAPEPTPVVVEKIIEKVVEQPKVVETVVIGEESVEASRLRYDKSFEAKFIQSDDEVKHWYTEVKNELLSYKGCKGRISWKRETFKAKKEVVAKLVFRGNTLCLFLPLNVADFVDDKNVEDASNLPVYEDTPVMVRIKNEKRKRLALELIGRVMAERQILCGAHQTEDFYLPYEGVVELINRGLIKREIKTVEDEAIFERDKEEE